MTLKTLMLIRQINIIKVYNMCLKQYQIYDIMNTLENCTIIHFSFETYYICIIITNN